MPELRFDPTTADWVVFAPLRALRPHAAQDVASKSADGADGRASCPFCPGNEEFSTKEIDAVRYSSAPSDWKVRVIPNKFPALRIEESPARVSDQENFQRMGGCGAHEVVVESPDHDSCLAKAEQGHVESLIQILHRRYIDLMRDFRFQSVVIFKNHGEAAGTSLPHPHWQIIATPVVPRMLRLKSSEAIQYYDRTGRCLYQDLTHSELRQQKRVICQNEEFVAFIPYAAHLAFETWILPRRLQASFSQIEAGQIAPLASILKDVLLRLYVGLENPDFNLTIDTAPRGDEGEAYFQWHIRILPRLSTSAGFELGSGMSINTVLPEDAAAFLRNGTEAVEPR